MFNVPCLSFRCFAYCLFTDCIVSVLCLGLFFHTKRNRLTYHLQSDTLTEAENENAVNSEVIPDFSQLRVPLAETLTPLEDVNTKLFIGTEVIKAKKNVKRVACSILMCFYFQSGEIIYSDWKKVIDNSGSLESEYSGLPLLKCIINNSNCTF